MKIAIPAKGGMVSDHFGHCEYYMVYHTDDAQILSKEIVAAPNACGCKSDIGLQLQTMGVSVMLAGNMGTGAYHTMLRYGIESVRGCRGSVDEVVEQYLKGLISDSLLVCDHNHKDGDCSNHHN